MNRELLKRWKTKTQSLFSIVEYSIFWTYFDDLERQKKRLDKANEFMKCAENVNAESYMEVIQFYKRLNNILQGRDE